MAAQSLIQPERHSHSRKALTQEEILKVLRTASESKRNLAMILLAYRHGMRAIEVCELHGSFCQQRQELAVLAASEAQKELAEKFPRDRKFVPSANSVCNERPVKARLSQNLSRDIATECPTCRSCVACSWCGSVESECESWFLNLTNDRGILPGMFYRLNTRS